MKIWKANRGIFANLLVIGVFSFLVCYPLFLLIKGSFHEGMIADPTSTFTLTKWITAFTSSSVNKALLNTLILVATYNAIAIPVSILISWFLARTNMPGRGWLEFGFWISFFMPALSIIQGWILLLDPHYGLINMTLMRWFSLSQAPFDLYTYGGIIFIQLVTVMVSGNVMLMTPAFKNMNSSLEEASQVAGDSKLKTLIRIFIPVMAPSILVSSILGIIRSLESFEVELILGTPKRIEVYSTYIFRLIRKESADYGLASTMGIIVMGIMFLLIFLQYRVTGRKSYTTVSGKHQSGKVDLGKWKWTAFLFVTSVVLMLTAVPTVFLCIGTLMTSFGFFNLPEVWTLDHWRSVLTDNVFIGSLWNTLKLAIGTALFAVAACFLLAYIIVRTKFFGRKWLDIISWIPYSTPGILYSLAFLWFIFSTPFLQSLYGSTIILILAVGTSMFTLGVQMIKSSLVQVGSELEEASWTSKASWWYTIRRVVFPLSIHSIAVVGILGFVSAGKNVSHLSLLATSDNRPLAIMQLEYMLEGRYEAASIVGLIVVLMIVVVAVAARVLGFNIGTKHD